MPKTYTYYQPLGPRDAEHGGYVLFSAVDDYQTMRYIPVFDGDFPEAESSLQALEMLFARHNADDRPRGQEIRSMCIGDVVVCGDKAWIVETVGWRELEAQEWPELLESPPAALGYPLQPGELERIRRGR